jgi:Rrf2 family protein
MLELAGKFREPQVQPLRVKDIADAQGIPARFLIQILLQLKTAGLVASVRGASGGYQLARSPDRINLAEVINAVDDRGLASPSALGDPRLSGAVEVLTEVWKALQVEEQRLLERITLAELIRRSERGSELSYQI